MEGCCNCRHLKAFPIKAKDQNKKMISWESDQHNHTHTTVSQELPAFQLVPVSYRSPRIKTFPLLDLIRSGFTEPSLSPATQL